MGKFSRDKGARFERQIVNLLQDQYGFAAEKIPLSGACGGSFGGDISVPILGTDRRFEAKSRATGFTQLYDWIEGNWGLYLKADRKPTLVCIRLTDAADVLKEAEGYRADVAMRLRSLGMTL